MIMSSSSPNALSTFAETALPEIVSYDEWLIARKQLLAREKELTRARDELNAARRRLPMVRIEKSYALEGPNGKVSLLELFEDRALLYVHHFMWIDARDAPCPTCSFVADMNFNSIPFLAHLNARDVTFVATVRAPWTKVADLRARKGWTFPMYSSFDSDFNYDFHATLDESRAPIEYNYRTREELRQAGFSDATLQGDYPLNTVFLRDGTDVFLAYATAARGLDQLFTPYNFLDLTPYGRQEPWEDSPPGWPQRNGMI
jgi:predicted dithiol-disulfide oxidoreductase (DUF899 family)